MSAKLESQNDPTVLLAKQILSVESISPDNSSVQEVLSIRLAKIGFTIRQENFNGCKSFWAKLGEKSPLFVFSGHSDVVPPGEVSNWSSPPFKPQIRDGLLYARGACDMKGSLAAMVVATEQFLDEHQGELPFSIGFLVSGDEEIGGKAAKTFLDSLYSSGERIDYCLVAEPSSVSLLGDTLKIGRRGSLTGTLQVFGVQGHVGYPSLARNALHSSLMPLQELLTLDWVDGSEYFQPTSFQVTGLHAGVASNVIPGEAVVTFNLRYSLSSQAEELKERIESILGNHLGDSYKITWSLDAEPFLTTPSNFTTGVVKMIRSNFGLEPVFSTAGGTSDARYFAKKGAEVFELGPIGTSIHQCDEFVSLADLVKLTKLYKEVLGSLLNN